MEPEPTQFWQHGPRHRSRVRQPTDASVNSGAQHQRHTTVDSRRRRREQDHRGDATTSDCRARIPLCIFFTRVLCAPMCGHQCFLVRISTARPPPPQGPGSSGVVPVCTRFGERYPRDSAPSQFAPVLPLRRANGSVAPGAVLSVPVGNWYSSTMVSPSVVDSVYERAASFGRDVFHYVVTGAMFAIVSSVPWWSDIPWGQIRESSQIAALLVATAVLFGLGHVLLAVGFWIRNKIVPPDDSTRWDRFWNWTFVRFFCCRVQVKEYCCAIARAREAMPAALVVGNEPASSVHLGLEMSVLLKQPVLHAVFIERYNTLWHLRLGLAASFLLAGVVDLVVATCSIDLTPCLRNQRFPVVVGGVIGSASIVLGWLLMRQHLVTNTHFLQRVLVAFNISEQKIV